VKPDETGRYDGKTFLAALSLHGQVNPAGRGAKDLCARARPAA